MVRFRLNSRDVAFDGDPEMPLLWYLRDHAGLTGTKFGCGVGQCGACTVHLDDQAIRSCMFPMAGMEGRSIVTIEGLGGSGSQLHPVQRAWIEEDVAQCGYCQVGQIMTTASLLKRVPAPTDDDIASIGNLCRCGTYPRIRRAIKRAIALSAEERDA